MLNWEKKGGGPSYDVISLGSIATPVVVHDNWSNESEFTVLPDSCIEYNHDKHK